MNRYTLEDFHNDPELLGRLSAAAHRERSRAIGNAAAGLLRWIVRLFDLPKTRDSLRPPRWIARLG